MHGITHVKSITIYSLVEDLDVSACRMPELDYVKR
jgi:hypothetical protein